jgi:hypothetical protein
VKGAAVACPVCGKGHRNAQGLGGHLAHSKDQDHVLYRTTGALPATPPAPARAAPSAPVASEQAAPAAPMRPPPKPFTPEWGAWMAEQFNQNLATWLKQREERRAHAPASPAPAATRHPQAEPAPPERVEDFGDAYWRSILGTGYRARKEDARGP